MQFKALDVTVTTTWTPLYATSLGFRGKATPAFTNAVDIKIRAVGDTDEGTLTGTSAEDTGWIMGDLNKIEVKTASSTAVLKLLGNTDVGFK